MGFVVSLVGFGAFEAGGECVCVAFMNFQPLRCRRVEVVVVASQA